MTHYAIVHLIPKDADLLAEYRVVGKAAIEKHGGVALAGGPGAEVLENADIGAPAAVVIGFPDAAAAHGWMNDPDLAGVHALRNRAARSTIVLLPPLGG